VVVSDGVHQVAAGAAPRDAITHHMLEARDVLRGLGLRSEIFVEADHIHDGLRDSVHAAPEWDEVARPGDAAILHYSIASSAFTHVMDRCDRCALHYHNITPAELLWRFAPQVALECAIGRRRLVELAGRVAAVGADSAYNAQELGALGFRAATVLGVMRQRLPPLARLPRRPEGPARLLFVGRGIPNKAQHHLIMASAALDDAGLDHEMRLVGAWTGAPAYERHCRALAAALGVERNVVFAGSVGEAELGRSYAEADLFLCLSDHEGFCVPLLEAMAASLPIVAYASSAIPETLGGAGLLLDDKAPSLVAEAVVEALGNPRLAAAHAAARPAQLHRFDQDELTRRLVRFVETIP
jgi:glycosyltransferase involved in cell wall biosynthesis